MRTNVAGAARATGATTNTISRWLRASERAWSELDEEALARRHDLFKREEVSHTGRRSGTGEEWALDLDALQRVHTARGGTYWNADAALTIARLPPSVAAELARLAELERDNAALRRQLVAARSATAGAPAPAPATRIREPRTGHVPTRPAEETEAFRAIPKLPSGYLAVSTFCKQRGVDDRSVRRLIELGHLPQPDTTEYRSGPNVVRQSWSPQTQQEVRLYLATYGAHNPQGAPLPDEFAEA